MYYGDCQKALGQTQGQTGVVDDVSCQTHPMYGVTSSSFADGCLTTDGAIARIITSSPGLVARRADSENISRYSVIVQEVRCFPLNSPDPLSLFDSRNQEAII